MLLYLQIFNMIPLISARSVVTENLSNFCSAILDIFEFKRDFGTLLESHCNLVDDTIAANCEICYLMRKVKVSAWANIHKFKVFQVSFSLD